MATGSKCIATKENCNSIVSGAFTSSSSGGSTSLKDCVTYKDVIDTGKFKVSTVLENSRLTRYEYISKKLTATATPNPTTINAAGHDGGGGGSTITVTNATGWTASVDSAYTSWLGCLSNGSTLIAHCTANTGSSSRTGYITVTPTGVASENIIQTSKVTVVQSLMDDASISISPSNTTINFSYDPDADDVYRNITVSVNNATDWTYSESIGWLTVSKPNPSTLLITTPDINEGADRSGTITLTTTGGRTTASLTITVNQPGFPPKVTVSPTKINFSTNSASGATITVTKTNCTGFSFSSDSSWLSATSGTVTAVLVTANTGAADRSGKITVTPTGGTTSGTPQTATVNVTQKGTGATIPTISASPTSLSFTAGGGSKTISVTYGGTATGYTASIPSGNWASVSKSGNTVTVTAQANTGSARTGACLIYPQINGSNSGTPASVSLSQAAGGTTKTVSIKRHIFTIPDTTGNYYVQIPGVVVYNGSAVDQASVISYTAVSTSYTTKSTSAGLSSLPTGSFSLEALPATSNTLSGCYSIYKKGENGERGAGYGNVVPFGTPNSAQIVTLQPDPVFMECNKAPTGNTDEFHIVYQDTTQANHVPNSQGAPAPGWINLNLSLGQLTVKFMNYVASWSFPNSSVYVVFSTSAIPSFITTKDKWMSAKKVGRLAVSSSTSAGGTGKVLISGTWSAGYIGVYVGGYLWQGQITTAVANALNRGSTTSINLIRTLSLS